MNCSAEREVPSRLAVVVFFFQAEDGIRGPLVTGVQTCALPIFGSDLNVEAGTLNFNGTWTGQKLTLGGGSFGGSGGLTVSSFSWNGGTLGDGGGSLTSGAATISGTADHYMQGGYTWTANGTTTWSGGRLHGLVPASLATGNDFQLTSTGTFNIRTDGDFIADPVSDGKPHIFFQSSGTLDKTDTGTPGQTEIEMR